MFNLLKLVCFPCFQPIMFVRHKFSINNCVECITDGTQLFMTSRGKNQFLQYRELSLGCPTCPTCFQTCFAAASRAVAPSGSALAVDNGGMEQSKSYFSFFSNIQPKQH